jgi:glyoxalase family protein
VGGIHHVALGVASEDGLLKWKRRLTDAGVAVAGPYDRGWFHSIYFADHDGQILEIATKGPGYAVDEPVDALGGSVIQPRPEQLRGNRDEEAIARRTWPEPVVDITRDMALDGIHHVTGITSDVERMGAFYEETLGLRPIKKSVNQDDGATAHWFWGSYDGTEVKPHSSLTMFDWKGSTHMSRGGAGQTHHVAFRARDAEQQGEWREELLRLGLDVSPVLDRDYFTSIYFRAPDGLLMEIATDGPGFAVDEEPAALGTSLRLPAWLEERRDEIAASLPSLP